MRAVVVYESMFGNTHTVANCIADGLRWRHDCQVVAVGDSPDDLVHVGDLVVVGGPTHIHGLSSATSRSSAAEMAIKDDALDLDPDAGGQGLRDWLSVLPNGCRRASAAFDTRADGSPAFTGRASKGIGRRLHRHGYRLLIEPESFLVDKHNHLLDGEERRAEEWGQELAAALVTDAVS